ncbi:outer membrane beta-barrel family protein [Terrimonas sp. NA20]|uniref:Outer membrane beta-barrel family protein n=1 Tax=Terrimonas ginsenosidimutans TaxID=2908004 RepID=A0ABS9KZE4_9BACT|nr:outer membrane beta-barrel family protein [Terrimonas ginsenosidimutans]MCG2617752.1 outer membrane beta-barrel family protein [Terrimonas ginsenosidimutans]
MNSIFTKTAVAVISLTVSGMMLTHIAYGQQFDVENINKDVKGRVKNPFKLTGGISANTILYTGNAGSQRAPFTYFVNGNIAANILGVSVPLSFTFTNTGFAYNYRLPSMPNRLSLHPRYKWVTGHIGQISMNYSNYTVNGIPINGVGADLSPRGNWKYSVFYGNLQRAVEYRNDDSLFRNVLPAYKRFGYGSKISYDNAGVRASVIFFQAKDRLNSLLFKPDSLQVYPMANTAISGELKIPLLKNLSLESEYAISAMTRDLRAPAYGDSNSVNWLVKTMGGKLSTNLYKAYKSQLTYTIGSTSLGAGYERIDPGYQTLAMLYFNNDLEKITANFAQSLFKGKVNLAGNIGLQRDDLDKKKAGSSSRTVGSLNLNYNISQALTTTLSYSNFQTFTNIKPQFQYINQLTPYDNLDTLDYRQLSQQANLNVNYVITKDKDRPRNLNLNFSFQDSYDQQAGLLTKGNTSQFYNFAGSYSVTHVPRDLNFLGAVNITYNTIGINNYITYGPTIGVNKQFLKKTIRTGLTVSHNQSMADGAIQNNITSFRMNAGYVYKKKHLFNMTNAGMFRSVKGKSGQHDFTCTIGYNYSF